MTTPAQHPASTSDARERAADLATPDRGSDLREPLDLDAIRARANAATEGPWDFWCADDGRLEVYVPNGTMSTETVLNFVDYDDCPECARPTAADAEFIAHARTDVPALLAEVERLRAWGAVIAAVTPCSCSAQRARAETAEAERDAAREALARVEALADEWERNYASMLIAGFSGASVGADTAAKRIRAALAQPATDEATAKQGFVVRADEPRCWRSECRNGCGYPGACSEKPATDEGAGA